MEPLAFEAAVHPQSPYWDQAHGLLYMVDHMSGKIMCYNEAQKSVSSASLPGMASPSFLIKLTQPEDEFLVSDHLSTAVIQWDRASQTATKVRDAFSVEDSAKNYWNVAKASPSHKFFGGTVRGGMCSDTADPGAGMYVFDKSSGVRKLNLPNLKNSAGIAWNAQGNKVYHIAACQRNVREYDYDLKTGEISKCAFKLFNFNFVLF